MKYTKLLWSIFCCLPVVAALLVIPVQAQTTYTNAAYGFSAEVPENWHVYAEIKNDQFNNRAIIDWGLPPVYSESEGGNIENAVTITAYKREDITSVTDLMHPEFQRVSDILVSREQTATQPYISYLVTTSRNGLLYKTQTAFAYANGIGYIFVFTATPGTYAVNLPKFDSLLHSVRLFAPVTTPLAETSVALQFDGVYVTQSGTATVDSRTVDLYTFLRFYNDGGVYALTVPSTSAHTIGPSFGREGRFDKKGVYTLRGSELSFTLADGEAGTDAYHGQITDGDKLYLQMSTSGHEVRDFWFDFVPAE